MPNPFFKFKQFTVFHDKSSIKVGTDGVLLGAWASVNKPKKVLDIGTGSGLIAIMIAQRSEAKIIAVDIDISSINQANENFINSPWNCRLEALNISVQEFYSKYHEKFDLIITNPPYFSNSLKNKNNIKANARHNELLSYNDLLNISSQLLTIEGILALIIPYSETIKVVEIALKNNLFITRKSFVKPTPEKKPVRTLIEFSKIANKEYKVETLIIETSRHNYTNEYVTITKDFYLNF